MAGKRLFYHIFPYYLALIAVVLSASAWHMASMMKRFYYKQTEGELEVRGRIIEKQVASFLAAEDIGGLREFCREFSSTNTSRATVIAPDGKVLADSFENPDKMENHANRVEIKNAFAGEIGRAVHYSATMKQNMMYVARPVRLNGRVAAVLRVSVSMDLLNRTLSDLYMKTAVSGVIIALAAVFLGVFISRRITRPIMELDKGAANFAKGDFSRKLSVSGIVEIGELAGTLNYMAGELNRRMLDLAEQRNLQEAILSSMLEGVVAVDSEGSIISVNRSASSLLKISGVCDGKLFHEVVRNAALQSFIDGVLAGNSAAEREISVFDNEKREIYLRGTALNDASGGCIGALIVMSDVTRLKRLEGMRSDFVANVSHEIKTPLTAIMAAVETLNSGSLEQAEAGHLLKIISRHSDRLNEIIGDILSLSRLEQGKDAQGDFPETLVERIIGSSVEDCRAKADEKKLAFRVSCNSAIIAPVKSSLIEQALVNLIDNAIKYSEPGSEIGIDAIKEDGSVRISVRDSGCGIPAEHLPRIFERFYRVDKARSRKLGGTGLGLAIVKHIVQVHGGRVEVESSVGKGSRFTIVLPAAKPSA